MWMRYILPIYWLFSRWETHNESFICVHGQRIIASFKLKPDELAHSFLIEQSMDKRRFCLDWQTAWQFAVSNYVGGEQLGSRFQTQHYLAWYYPKFSLIWIVRGRRATLLPLANWRVINSWQESQPFAWTFWNFCCFLLCSKFNR